MKKTSVKIIVVALVLVTCLSLFAACGLSGTYSAEVDLFGLAGANVDYKFAGNKVTITVTAGIAGFEKTTEFDGKYEIVDGEEEGTKNIVFKFEGEDAETYNGSFSFEKGEDSIIIGGVTYNKKK